LTKIITLSSKTSVKSSKFLISQKPKIANVLFPYINGLTSPPDLIFDAIILEPASPKPIANNAPVLIIRFSKIVVSNDYLINFYFISLAL